MGTGFAGTGSVPSASRASSAALRFARNAATSSASLSAAALCSSSSAVSCSTQRPCPCTPPRSRRTAARRRSAAAPARAPLRRMGTGFAGTGSVPSASRASSAALRFARNAATSSASLSASALCSSSSAVSCSTAASLSMYSSTVTAYSGSSAICCGSSARAAASLMGTGFAGTGSVPSASRASSAALRFARNAATSSASLSASASAPPARPSAAPRQRPCPCTPPRSRRTAARRRSAAAPVRAPLRRMAQASGTGSVPSASRASSAALRFAPPSSASLSAAPCSSSSAVSCSTAASLSMYSTVTAYTARRQSCAPARAPLRRSWAQASPVRAACRPRRGPPGGVALRAERGHSSASLSASALCSSSRRQLLHGSVLVHVLLHGHGVQRSSAICCGSRRRRCVAHGHSFAGTGSVPPVAGSSAALRFARNAPPPPQASPPALCSSSSAVSCSTAASLSMYSSTVTAYSGSSAICCGSSARAAASLMGTGFAGTGSVPSASRASSAALRFARNAATSSASLSASALCSSSSAVSCSTAASLSMYSSTVTAYSGSSAICCGSSARAAASLMGTGFAGTGSVPSASRASSAALRFARNAATSSASLSASALCSSSSAVSCSTAASLSMYSSTVTAYSGSSAICCGSSARAAASLMGTGFAGTGSVPSASRASSAALRFARNAATSSASLSAAALCSSSSAVSCSTAASLSMYSSTVTAYSGSSAICCGSSARAAASLMGTGFAGTGSVPSASRASSAALRFARNAATSSASLSASALCSSSSAVSCSTAASLSMYSSTVTAYSGSSAICCGSSARAAASRMGTGFAGTGSVPSASRASSAALRFARNAATSSASLSASALCSSSSAVSCSTAASLSMYSSTVTAYSGSSAICCGSSARAAASLMGTGFAGTGSVPSASRASSAALRFARNAATSSASLSAAALCSSSSAVSCSTAASLSMYSSTVTAYSGSSAICCGSSARAAASLMGTGFAGTGSVPSASRASSAALRFARNAATSSASLSAAALCSSSSAVSCSTAASLSMYSSTVTAYSGSSAICCGSSARAAASRMGTGFAGTGSVPSASRASSAALRFARNAATSSASLSASALCSSSSAVSCSTAASLSMYSSTVTAYSGSSAICCGSSARAAASRMGTGFAGTGSVPSASRASSAALRFARNAATSSASLSASALCSSSSAVSCSTAASLSMYSSTVTAYSGSSAICCGSSARAAASLMAQASPVRAACRPRRGPPARRCASRGTRPPPPQASPPPPSAPPARPSAAPRQRPCPCTPPRSRRTAARRRSAAAPARAPLRRSWAQASPVRAACRPRRGPPARRCASRGTRPPPPQASPPPPSAPPARPSAAPRQRPCPCTPPRSRRTAARRRSAAAPARAPLRRSWAQASPVRAACRPRRGPPARRCASRGTRPPPPQASPPPPSAPPARPSAAPRQRPCPCTPPRSRRTAARRRSAAAPVRAPLRRSWAQASPVRAACRPRRGPPARRCASRGTRPPPPQASPPPPSAPPARPSAAPRQRPCPCTPPRSRRTAARRRSAAAPARAPLRRSWAQASPVRAACRPRRGPPARRCASRGTRPPPPQASPPPPSAPPARPSAAPRQRPCPCTPPRSRRTAARRRSAAAPARAPLRRAWAQASPVRAACRPRRGPPARRCASRGTRPPPPQASPPPPSAPPARPSAAPRQRPCPCTPPRSRRTAARRRSAAAPVRAPLRRSWAQASPVRAACRPRRGPPARRCASRGTRPPPPQASPPPPSAPPARPSAAPRQRPCPCTPPRSRRTAARRRSAAAPARAPLRRSWAQASPVRAACRPRRGPPARRCASRGTRPPPPQASPPPPSAPPARPSAAPRQRPCPCTPPRSRRTAARRRSAAAPVRAPLRRAWHRLRRYGQRAVRVAGLQRGVALRAERGHLLRKPLRLRPLLLQLGRQLLHGSVLVHVLLHGHGVQRLVGDLLRLQCARRCVAHGHRLRRYGQRAVRVAGLQRGVALRAERGHLLRKPLRLRPLLLQLGRQLLHGSVLVHVLLHGHGVQRLVGDLLRLQCARRCVAHGHRLRRYGQRAVRVAGLQRGVALRAERGHLLRKPLRRRPLLLQLGRQLLHGSVLVHVLLHGHGVQRLVGDLLRLQRARRCVAHGHRLRRYGQRAVRVAGLQRGVALRAERGHLLRKPLRLRPLLLQLGRQLLHGSVLVHVLLHGHGVQRLVGDLLRLQRARRCVAHGHRLRRYGQRAVRVAGLQRGVALRAERGHLLRKPLRRRPLLLQLGRQLLHGSVLVHILLHGHGVQRLVGDLLRLQRARRCVAHGHRLRRYGQRAVRVAGLQRGVALRAERGHLLRKPLRLRPLLLQLGRQLLHGSVLVHVLLHGHGVQRLVGDLLRLQCARRCVAHGHRLRRYGQRAVRVAGLQRGVALRAERGHLLRKPLRLRPLLLQLRGNVGDLLLFCGKRLLKIADCIFGLIKPILRRQPLRIQGPHVRIVVVLHKLRDVVAADVTVVPNGHACMQTPECKLNLGEVIAPDTARSAHIHHECVVKRVRLVLHNSPPVLALKHLLMAGSTLRLRLIAVVSAHVVLLEFSNRKFLLLTKSRQRSVLTLHCLQQHQHILKLGLQSSNVLTNRLYTAGRILAGTTELLHGHGVQRLVGDLLRLQCARRCVAHGHRLRRYGQRAVRVAGLQRGVALRAERGHLLRKPLRLRPLLLQLGRQLLHGSVLVHVLLHGHGVQRLVGDLLRLQRARRCVAHGHRLRRYGQRAVRVAGLQRGVALRAERGHLLRKPLRRRPLLLQLGRQLLHGSVLVHVLLHGHGVQRLVGDLLRLQRARRCVAHGHRLRRYGQRAVRVAGLQRGVALRAERGHLLRKPLRLRPLLLQLGRQLLHGSVLVHVLLHGHGVQRLVGDLLRLQRARRCVAHGHRLRRYGQRAVRVAGLQRGVALRAERGHLLRKPLRRRPLLLQLGRQLLHGSVLVHVLLHGHGVQRLVGDLLRLQRARRCVAHGYRLRRYGQRAVRVAGLQRGVALRAERGHLLRKPLRLRPLLLQLRGNVGDLLLFCGKRLLKIADCIFGLIKPILRRQPLRIQGPHVRIVVVLHKLRDVVAADVTVVPNGHACMQTPECKLNLGEVIAPDTARSAHIHHECVVKRVRLVLHNSPPVLALKHLLMAGSTLRLRLIAVVSAHVVLLEFSNRKFLLLTKSRQRSVLTLHCLQQHQHILKLGLQSSNVLTNRLYTAGRILAGTTELLHGHGVQRLVGDLLRLQCARRCVAHGHRLRRYGQRAVRVAGLQRGVALRAERGHLLRKPLRRRPLLLQLGRQLLHGSVLVHVLLHGHGVQRLVGDLLRLQCARRCVAHGHRLRRYGQRAVRVAGLQRGVALRAERGHLLRKPLRRRPLLLQLGRQLLHGSVLVHVLLHGHGVQRLVGDLLRLQRARRCVAHGHRLRRYGQRAVRVAGLQRGVALRAERGHLLRKPLRRRPLLLQLGRQLLHGSVLVHVLLHGHGVQRLVGDLLRLQRARRCVAHGHRLRRYGQRAVRVAGLQRGVALRAERGHLLRKPLRRRPLLLQLGRQLLHGSVLVHVLLHGHGVQRLVGDLLRLQRARRCVAHGHRLRRYGQRAVRVAGLQRGVALRAERGHLLRKPLRRRPLLLQLGRQLLHGSVLVHVLLHGHGVQRLVGDLLRLQRARRCVAHGHRLRRYGQRAVRVAGLQRGVALRAERGHLLRKPLRLRPLLLQLGRQLLHGSVLVHVLLHGHGVQRLVGDLLRLQRARRCVAHGHRLRRYGQRAVRVAGLQRGVALRAERGHLLRKPLRRRPLLLQLGRQLLHGSVLVHVLLHGHGVQRLVGDLLRLQCARRCVAHGYRLRRYGQRAVRVAGLQRGVALRAERGHLLRKPLRLRPLLLQLRGNVGDLLLFCGKRLLKIADCIFGLIKPILRRQPLRIQGPHVRIVVVLHKLRDVVAADVTVVPNGHACMQTPECKLNLGEVIAPDTARSAHIHHECVVKRVRLVLHNSPPVLALKHLLMAGSTLRLRLIAVVSAHVVLLEFSNRKFLLLTKSRQRSVLTLHCLQQHQHILKLGLQSSNVLTNRLYTAGRILAGTTELLHGHGVQRLVGDLLRLQCARRCVAHGHRLRRYGQRAVRVAGLQRGVALRAERGHLLRKPLRRRPLLLQLGRQLLHGSVLVHVLLHGHGVQRLVGDLLRLQRARRCVAHGHRLRRYGQRAVRVAGLQRGVALRAERGHLLRKPLRRRPLLLQLGRQLLHGSVLVHVLLHGHGVQRLVGDLLRLQRARRCVAHGHRLRRYGQRAVRVAGLQRGVALRAERGHLLRKPLRRRPLLLQLGRQLLHGSVLVHVLLHGHGVQRLVGDLLRLQRARRCVAHGHRLRRYGQRAVRVAGLQRGVALRAERGHLLRKPLRRRPLLLQLGRQLLHGSVLVHVLLHGHGVQRLVGDLLRLQRARRCVAHGHRLRRYGQRAVRVAGLQRGVALRAERGHLLRKPLRRRPLLLQLGRQLLHGSVLVHVLLHGHGVQRLVGDLLRLQRARRCVAHGHRLRRYGQRAVRVAGLQRGVALRAERGHLLRKPLRLRPLLLQLRGNVGDLLLFCGKRLLKIADCIFGLIKPILRRQPLRIQGPHVRIVVVLHKLRDVVAADVTVVPNGHACMQTPECKLNLGEVIAPDTARSAHIHHECVVKRVRLVLHNSPPVLALKHLLMAGSTLRLRLIAVVSAHVVLLEFSNRKFLLLTKSRQRSVLTLHCLQQHQHILKLGLQSSNVLTNRLYTAGRILAGTTELLHGHGVQRLVGDLLRLQCARRCVAHGHRLRRYGQRAVRVAGLQRGVALRAERGHLLRKPLRRRPLLLQLGRQLLHGSVLVHVLLHGHGVQRLVGDLLRLQRARRCVAHGHRLRRYGQRAVRVAGLQRGVALRAECFKLLVLLGIDVT
ncbi:flagellar attachment zone protein, putative [Leishmania tarentolae]|uniref:Flagellar attachment zone protein, putative n=1 Tax=Leishmania tarentolae TaxID=5689 RepID=A0A640KSF1_LEITA|nr:flagellar attachment zone protein, putative [Leishmania tarentolae]